MIVERVQSLRSSLWAVDVAVVIGAWIGAFYLRLLVAFFVPIVWGPLARLARLYSGGVLLGSGGQALSILKTTTLTSVALVAISHFLSKLSISRVFVVYFWILGSLALWILRKVIRGVLARRARRSSPRRCLIVGTGSLARRTGRLVNEHPELGLCIAGFVSVGREKVGRTLDGTPILGHIGEIRALIRAESAQGLLVALPIAAGAQLDRLLVDLHDELIHISVVPDVSRYSGMKANVSTIEALPIVSLTASPMFGWASIAKRLTDICGSLALLVLTAPLIGAIALLIKLTSRGPVLYVQARMGLRGQTFKLVKFRTMRIDAELTTGPVWARHDDPRCTPLGRLLRRTGLDELPQLWQVLKGEMSLVGPRPERPVFVEGFRHSVPRYMLRHRVKAGVTGWAQVNGWRGDTGIEERVAHDLEYIRSWSLTLDLKILALTLLQGFRGKRPRRRASRGPIERVEAASRASRVGRAVPDAVERCADSRSSRDGAPKTVTPPAASMSARPSDRRQRSRAIETRRESTQAEGP
jgi:exopolysaccharide biosynthesis polyprenyl glycosylphosphotransferase